MAKRLTEKQVQLEKYLAITLAAIDFNSEREIGSMVYDGHDPMIGIYEWQRNQVRSFFAQRRLDHLERKFHSYTRWMSSNGDVTFNDYVKERTGYTIDINALLREDVEPILDRGIIDNEAEHHKVSSLLHVLAKSETDKELFHKLGLLLLEYAKTKKPSRDLIYQTEYEKDGIIVQEVTISSGGGSRQDYESDRLISPDGRKRIFISRSGRKLRAYTTMTIYFPKGSGCILQANVNSPGITARWQDDQTIVIKTKSEFEMPIQVKEVISHGERVNLIYEELS
jgi:hypothetical protein